MKKVTTLLAAGFAVAAGVAQAEESITVVSWGGAYTCLLYTSPSPRD